jgi:pyridoxamine 5'-phosphate oxidase
MKKNTPESEPLDRILNQIWHMLRRGVTHSHDPFHYPVLGTMGKKSCSMRTVILRQFSLPDRILVCYTDSRAPKVKEIEDCNNVIWLFYHPKKKIQLRMSGKASLHTDDQFADDQWAGSRITSRLNYCATQPPGIPVDSPMSGLPDFLLNKVPSMLNTEKGRKYFMAIASKIQSIDWLELRMVGNRRALFTWDDEDSLSVTWLIP